MDILHCAFVMLHVIGRNLEEVDRDFGGGMGGPFTRELFTVFGRTAEHPNLNEAAVLLQCSALARDKALEK